MAPWSVGPASRRRSFWRLPAAPSPRLRGRREGRGPSTGSEKPLTRPSLALPPQAGEGTAMGVSNNLPGPEHAVRCAMERFESRRSDAAKFAELDAGLEIASDDVGLHHQAHVFLQRECRHLSGRTAP